MDFVVGWSGTDPQQCNAHIVVYSCRGASKISKITGSGPDLRPSAKNDENFKKSQKITFSKLVRGSVLHIPCALWELRNTSKRVFRIDFEPFRSLDRNLRLRVKNFKKSLKLKFSKHIRKSFLNIPCTLWVMRDTHKHIFILLFDLQLVTHPIPFYPTQTKKLDSQSLRFSAWLGLVPAYPIVHSWTVCSSIGFGGLGLANHDTLGRHHWLHSRENHNRLPKGAPSALQAWI